jgi:hypothetical protein
MMRACQKYRNGATLIVQYIELSTAATLHWCKRLGRIHTSILKGFPIWRHCRLPIRCTVSSEWNAAPIVYIRFVSDSLTPRGHNTRSLKIIQAVSKELGHVTNVAYFDSAFHLQIPRHIHTYPISPKIASLNKLRKYGFHGISYSFIVKAIASFINKPVSETNIIALHLGSGASACAIKYGASLDTSMGLTPLSGLPGATRSGTLDPVWHSTKPTRLAASARSPQGTCTLRPLRKF